MTRGMFERLARRHLLPSLPGFAIARGLIYKGPIEWLLRAFVFVPSAFSKEDFYVHVAVQPLYLPWESVILDQGRRLGHWVVDPSQEGEVFADVRDRITQQGVPFLEKIATPLDYAENPPRHHLDGRVVAEDLEPLAYSYILASKYEAGRDLLEEWFARVAAYGPESSWTEYDTQRAARKRRVLEALDRDPTEAVAPLCEWRAYTLAHLGLDPDPSPA